MASLARIRGVLSPVVTPFDAQLRPVAEKIALLDALIDAGVSAAQTMPGTGCCALTDSVALTRHAVARGCAGVLMLPPFYYKSVSTDGLFRSYAEVIERVGESDLRVYLYHIPPVSQVPISLALIERLLRAYPETIAGIKDSSGDWGNTQAMLDRFQPLGFDVFDGSETFLLATLRGGGAGCITATGNVNPRRIAELARRWRDPDADTQQAALDAVRTVFQQFPMIPAAQGRDRTLCRRSGMGDSASAACRARSATEERARARTASSGLFDARSSSRSPRFAIGRSRSPRPSRGIRLAASAVRLSAGSGTK